MSAAAGACPLGETPSLRLLESIVTGFETLGRTKFRRLPLPPPIDKSGSLKFCDEFSDLWWHVQASGLYAVGFLSVNVRNPDTFATSARMSSAW